jgi:hypothetical protein
MRQCRREGTVSDSTLAEGTSPRGLTFFCTDKAGNIFFPPLCICRVVLRLLRKHRGVVGNGLGTTINYLRGAAGIGLGTTIKYLRCKTCAAAGNGLGSTIQGNARRRGYRPGHHDQVPATHIEWCRGQRPGHHDKLSARRRGHWPGHHDQVPPMHNERRRGQRPRQHDPRTCAAPRVSAWAPRSSTCDAQRVAPRTAAWAPQPSICDAQRAAPRATA